MQTIKKFWSLLPAFLLLTGCSTTITNITPSQQPRSDKGVYLIEAAWTTREQAIREQTIQPSVLVGTEFYPMQRTAKMTNRWEAYVPVPAGKNGLSYRFKFDYEVNKIPVPRPDSKLSPEYRLKVLDK